MKHLKSLDAVKSASVEELMEVPGMNRTSAENVYRFFRKNKDDNPAQI